jgi:hypothetical protein
MTGPLLDFILHTQEKDPRRAIAVVIPELARAHWWDYVLHTRRVRRLETILLREGGPHLAVVIVPWTLDKPHRAEASGGKNGPSSLISPASPDKTRLRCR